MRKYLPIALALATFAVAGSAPALAKTVHHRTGQIYMYAPGYAYAPYGGYSDSTGPIGTQSNGATMQDY
jgi:hypothetical protein